MTEEQRLAHRQGIPDGSPVMNCPTDGTVAMLPDKLGANLKTARCPLCDVEIEVGRFAVDFTRAYYIQREREAQANVTHTN